MTHFKLLTQLERDIRNQVVIDQMKRLNRKQKLMVLARRHFVTVAIFVALVLSALWTLFCIATVFAQTPEPNFAERFAGKIPCPDAQPCKVLVLTQQEENILVGKNGILDTAAQGRSLELGQFAVYLKQKLATATAGEVKKDESKPPAFEKPVPENPKPN